MDQTVKKENKFKFGKFMAWKSSDVSAAWVNWIVNTYMMLYCTDTLHIDAVVAGSLLLAANIFDAVTDILIGYVIDKSKVTKFGKVRPYEIAIVGVTISTLIMFMCPDNVDDVVKYIWVFTFYSFSFGIFNTMRYGASVPYLVRAWNNDSQLIGKVSAYGGLVTTMGAAVVTLLFPKLMGTFAYASEVVDGETVYHLTSQSWTYLMLIFMIPATVIGVFRFIFVKEDTSIDTGKEAIPFKFSEIIKMVTKNKYIWGYFLLIMAFQLTQNFGALSYYAKWVYGNEDVTGTIGIMSYFLLPLMLLIPPLLKKFGATKIITFSALFAIVGYVINFFAGNNLILLIVGSILTAIVTLPVSYLGNVILTQIFNYNEYKGIARQEATTTAIASSVATQLGQGFAPLITGLILSLASYDGTLLAQPASAITAIRVLYSFVPLVCIILILVASLFLNKLEKKSPQIEEELKLRKDN